LNFKFELPIVPIFLLVPSHFRLYIVVYIDLSNRPISIARVHKGLRIIYVHHHSRQALSIQSE
jgi:hypothetical protein